jgi:hypothetical protein
LIQTRDMKPTGSGGKPHSVAGNTGKPLVAAGRFIPAYAYRPTEGRNKQRVSGETGTRAITGVPDDPLARIRQAP